MKYYNHLATGLFCLFIGGFFVANAISPDTEFSETENRNLQKKPDFTMDTLISGDFTADYEKYITDQFVLRDRFVGLKASVEKALGKQENNGVYVLPNGTLIGKFENPDMDRVLSNAQAVEKFAKSVDIPVYATLVPTAAHVWRDKLPSYAPNYNQVALAETILKEWGTVSYIDSFAPLAAHKDEDVFYRTDHHWTTLGAYYGYEALARGLGFTPVPLESYEKETVTQNFYGTYHSKSGVRTIAADQIDSYVPQGNTSVAIFEGDTPKQGSLYDPSFLDKKDKYSYFFGGNHPLVRISTGKEGKNLLIIKDSYSNSQIPFWTAHYNKIYVVDLRMNKSSMKDFIKENAIDEVLVQYSISNFASDSNLVFLAR